MDEMTQEEIRELLKRRYIRVLEDLGYDLKARMAPHTHDPENPVWHFVFIRPGDTSTIHYIYDAKGTKYWNIEDESGNPTFQCTRIERLIEKVTGIAPCDLEY